ncbi:MAG: DNA translocase FtsK [Prevotellaceae bacterium]|jgi:S-DNA-T family DNA segregation ATPase FtsK/SpoIIIE|nr:DNA translocase FtsK [Prevotellaceae bacterium]
MAKKSSPKSPATPSSGQSPVLFDKIVACCKSETIHFVVGIILILFAAFLLVACCSFFVTGAADQSVLEIGDLGRTDNGARNYAGSRGAQIANYLINDCFGVASFFIIVFIVVLSLKLMKVGNSRRLSVGKWFVGCSVLLVWFSVFFGFVFEQLSPTSFLFWGGRHGYNAARWLTSQIGMPGVVLLLLAVALCMLIYHSARAVDRLRTLFSFGFLRRSQRHAPLSPASEEAPDAEAGDTPEEFTTSWSADGTPAIEPAPAAPAAETPKKSAGEPTFEVEIPDESAAPYAADPEEEPLPAEPHFEVSSREAEEEYRGKEREPYNPRLDLSNYHFPPIELMKHYEQTKPAIDMDEQNANKDKIISTLRSFGIEISTIKATVGPTVTLYEITPEQGVRISKIRGLEDDIALSLAALGIRIIAPIPGKGTIGIEVPNSNPRIVSGQSIIGSKRFQESTYDLPIALGKTITDEVFMVDLCKMPHILVAGATGQGKSVGLNAIITSLLYKKHPAELKFVLVDPKKVEFSIYSVIEHHYLAKLPDGGDPIITDVKKVVQTLNSVCVEMDTRYDLLKAAHVRNIKEYNAKFIERRLNPEKGHRFMPYIVVVIDEFGDLIMTAGKEIELPIARIAQLARAVGIHMIIATQRPTTNIITGTIKANFPARVAFRVSAMIDSRTILDRPGANQLIGRGDMLFLQGADPVRVQCAFIDTPEVADITKYISQQPGYPTAFYLPEYVDESGGTDMSEVDMDRLDPLFEEAARLIVVHQQGSTSLIQRKFAIGYNRAGRLMDQLEKAGIVGATQGSKPRDVLITDESSLDAIMNNFR